MPWPLLPLGEQDPFGDKRVQRSRAALSMRTYLDKAFYYWYLPPRSSQQSCVLGISAAPFYRWENRVPTACLAEGSGPLTSSAFFFFFSTTGKKQQTLKDILSNKKLREHNSYVEVPALGAPEAHSPGRADTPTPAPCPRGRALLGLHAGSVGSGPGVWGNVCV